MLFPLQFHRPGESNGRGLDDSMDIEVRQARYQIRVYNPLTGDLNAVLTDWIALNYTKNVNDFHTFQLVLNSEDPNIQFFTLDALVEVWRRPDAYGVGWYREITTLFRTPQYNLYENGHETFTGYARGLNDFLHRRHVLYPANTANTLKSGPADNVMKAFVRENCTAAGNALPRKSFGTYDCTIYGLTVAPDVGLSPVWTGARSWNNLLDVLNDVSMTPSNTDFEIERVGTTGLQFEFITYYPQRGVDRGSEVTFTPDFSNMSNVIFTRSRTEEANVVFVLGQGEGTSRQVLPRSASPVVLAESRWNAIETTVDARSQDSVAAFTTTGDETLEKLKAQDQFEFAALQTRQRQYGVHYGVGDCVRAKYKAYATTKKIVSAAVSVADGVETINLEFADAAISVV